MKDSVDHIRRPTFPWRPTDESIVTECGYSENSTFNPIDGITISRDAFFVRLKEYGQQRTALFTCMTCSQTAKRHPTWEEDPRRALHREIEWECGWRKQTHGHRLKDELLAIAILIAEHKEEFDNLLKRLRQQQEWRERRTVNAPNSSPG